MEFGRPLPIAGVDSDDEDLVAIKMFSSWAGPVCERSRRAEAAKEAGRKAEKERQARSWVQKARDALDLSKPSKVPVSKASAKEKKRKQRKALADKEAAGDGGAERRRMEAAKRKEARAAMAPDAKAAKVKRQRDYRLEQKTLKHLRALGAVEA